MGGIDRELTQMEPMSQGPGHGKTRRRAGSKHRNPGVVTGHQRPQETYVGDRRVGHRRIAVIAEELRSAVLDGDQRSIVFRPAQPDREGSDRFGFPRQGSAPSTITMSASATVTRIAFAAWYSGEL